MRADHFLLVFGASARAAAHSGLRAGLRPWCADLFADADLQACCPALALSADDYPHGFLRVSHHGPPGPWLYTGALENHPALVRRLARLRPLWGNEASILKVTRSPASVRRIVAAAGLACPRLHFRKEPPRGIGRWLEKPFRGASGIGIRHWTGSARPRERRCTYLQELIEGDSHAALYVGNGRRAQLLGVTRQLVGADWLHARRFAYCGSVGPISLPPPVRGDLERLGNALVRESGMRGVFGVDYILNNEIAYPVEINPRYTASVEIVELSQGISALSLHQAVFDQSRPAGADVLVPVVRDAVTRQGTSVSPPIVLGKAVLYARAPLAFPDNGLWSATIQRRREDPVGSAWEVLEFADIPHAGQPINAGRPILTFFARADTVSGCLDRLRQIAVDLDARLWKR
jgi:predicted ATP-grasp superfamily ATP-dependent carboligase